MPSPERAPIQRWMSPAVALLLCTVVLTGPLTVPAHAQPRAIPDPCQLPVVRTVCSAVGGAATTVATAAGDFVMRGVTVWVTDAAVWVTGNVGELVENTTSPDLTASWFEAQYAAMLAVASVLALLMLMLAVIQSVIRQDVGMLLRAAFGYLPMAFILAGVAIAGTGLLVAITDDISSAVVRSLGTKQSTNLLQAVGDAYKNALDEDSGIPLFGVFLGAIILALGAFVLWLELIIRDAAIYICVFFLPLTFVAMIWPATSRWARRLVEFLVAIILAKFVIVAILTLATAAIANTNMVNGEGQIFERMIAGAALLVLAAWSPFALLRMIPMMEVAAASVASQRSSMSAAAGSAGIHSPAAYMRQAMDRNSRPSTSPAHPTTSSGTTYAQARTTERIKSTSSPVDGPSTGGERGAWTRPEHTTSFAGDTISPGTRQAGAPPANDAQTGPPTATEASPTRPAAQPSPPADPRRPPQPRSERRPPRAGGNA